MNNQAPIKSRAIDFAQGIGITKSILCSNVGLSKSTMSRQQLNSELGGDSILKILHHYPDLNPTWLLLGKEEMLLSAGKKEESKETETFYKLYLHEKEETKLLNEQNACYKAMISQIEEMLMLLASKLKSADLSTDHLSGYVELIYEMVKLRTETLSCIR